MLDLRRRQFITLHGGTAAACRSQHERVRWVGVVMVTNETKPETPLRAMAFRHALAKLGSLKGRNVI